MEDVLLLLNDWWGSNFISRDKAKGYRRIIFSDVLDAFSNYRQIIILCGLRRVGKTTIMYQLIEELLNRGVNPRNILYFSFDESVEDPVKILNVYSKVTKVDWKSENVYLFLDEVHKFKGWSSKVKLLYDSLKNLRICISGSASILVEREAMTNLAGRCFFFEIPPLTLREFAEIFFDRGMDNFEIYRDKLEMVFDDYIRKPFPEIVKWSDLRRVNEYIRSLVIEKVVKSDLIEIFGRVNPLLLSSLLEVFMKDVGVILNLSSMARDFGVHKLTLSEHIKFLEYGKIIRLVRNYRPSIRAESRKLVKIYPYNIALSLCFYPKLSEGQIMECLVGSAINANKYWRNKYMEIDFLKVNGELVPIEVKNKDSISKSDLKNIIWFMDKYDISNGIIVYSGKEDSIKINDKKIILYPISKLLFNFSLPLT